MHGHDCYSKKPSVPWTVSQFTSAHRWSRLKAVTALSDCDMDGIEEQYRNPEKGRWKGTVTTTPLGLGQHHNSHRYLGELALCWKERHPKGTRRPLQHWGQTLPAAVENVASDILGNWLVLSEFHAEASWELKERSKKSTVVRVSYFSWSEWGLSHQATGSADT